MRELLFGARMAVAGGRDGWLRTALTALGVGVGVTLLLFAASVPGAVAAREARTDARDPTPVFQERPPGPDTLLVATADTTFRDRAVRGMLLRPEGPDAPRPPGLAALPAAGEVVVSPALARLLDSPDGALFAPRLGGARMVGTIGRDGLTGPSELAFYAGSETLQASRSQRVTAFGGGPPGEEFGPILGLLVVIIFVVLLLPIVVFLGAAVRFGGERRDRRLAALRLVGADARMTRRIAAGEAAVGAMLGLVVGGLLFAVGRQLAPLVTVGTINVYADDVRPLPTAVGLIAIAVPTLAVVVGLAALRGVVVEPLGVSRRAGTARRRLWWRLLLPATGLVLLYPLVDGFRAGYDAGTGYQVALGAILLLVGTVTLLPWLVDVVVRRLRGGPVAWQLAVRRLQADGAGSTRLVNGISVAVAGAIGLQLLFAVVQAQSTIRTGVDTSRATVSAYVYEVADPSGALDRLAATPGLSRVVGTLSAHAGTGGPDGAGAPVRIGDCAALAEFAALDRCADGDVFLLDGPPAEGNPPPMPTPGTRLLVGAGEVPWTLPADARRVPARPDPTGWPRRGVLITPGAIDVPRLGALSVDLFALTAPDDPDAIERLRNVAAQIDPTGSVQAQSATLEDDRFTSIRRGLYAGIVVTLLLIGTSMLVGVLEQLRERRRLLAMLAAVGTRRGTLGWSVVWQATVPVVIGLVLAVCFGLALGAVLLRMVGAPFSIGWSAVGVSTGLGAATVLLVTVLSLPALWRLVGPDGLRTE
ncbi:FtsX-like permease family protein [Plantactinospora sp. GCM10030261]|uniref:FtsX-like permease family protein n=1 Tax=Plantactinospora sp. GCM10030261 TaxID=3273420 RepID=UPI003621A977